MLGKVVNLRQKRKQLARNENRKAADQNAAAYGLPKKLRNLTDARNVKAARDLDGHKRDE